MALQDLEKLETRITRLEDVLGIEKLQSTYMHWLSLGRADKIVELFALKTLGVSAEAGDSGVFEGPEGIKRHFSGNAEKRFAIGVYNEHRCVNPVIEISRDGKTAKAAWFSPGIMVDASKNSQAWAWGKYDNDYVKEDGKWKIWHLRWYQTFETPFEKGWLYQQETGSMRKPPLYPPDKEITHHLPYSPYRINYMVPEPPEPDE